MIFSVFFSAQLNLIASTSDDRSVRLWKIKNTSSKENKDLDWSQVEITLDRTMFGHLARVWKVVLLKDVLASIGEVNDNVLDSVFQWIGKINFVFSGF